MKGIILAGGSGSRLHPLTLAVSKQLLPVYEKPMIYYPLSVLMLAGIRDILIISTPRDLPAFKRLFRDGRQFGLQLTYAVQPSPDGLAQAFTIGRDFIKNESVCLVLGDNIFYGAGLQKLLLESRRKVEQQQLAVIFGYYVDDPERYGVASVDRSGKVIAIDEKPAVPKSNQAVVGLYFYPNSVIEVADGVVTSPRGELEITSVNQHFLDQGRLHLQQLSRGFAWLDTGTQESLVEATEFVKAVEHRTSLKIACLEEIAFRSGWISGEQLSELGDFLGKSSYGAYLKKIANNVESQAY